MEKEHAFVATVGVRMVLFGEEGGFVTGGIWKNYGWLFEGLNRIKNWISIVLSIQNKEVIKYLQVEIDESNVEMEVRHHCGDKECLLTDKKVVNEIFEQNHNRNIS